jgi:hypothetical protein
MYRHCTFCAADLGRNEVVEAFPVGRRMAFDAAKGRLWVICRRCERWNLTPLEERWEAVEEAERLFRATPLRVSTEQVGLARHREGLDLVRIGEPQRPEFAAWRYGDQFGRRRSKALVNGALGVGLVGAVAAGSVATLGGLAALNVGIHVFNVGRLVMLGIQPAWRVSLDSGERLELRPRDLRHVRIRPGAGDGPADPSVPWHLRLGDGPDGRILTGPEAVRALRVLLPQVNAGGAKKGEVADAVRELEEVGAPEAYFARAEFRARQQGWGWMPLAGQPAPIRLALEMAAHEDLERVALEGELAWLETAWREAEEVAAIADDLAIPERVRLHLETLKARHGRGRRSAPPDGGGETA